ncbi:hypothetical protein niasHT_033564 [Heterodera trifolii]|uniref:Uncharacterized protein n=1 Tax=Heterodera trifolii TaxID=157864 RepID=A0ABD2HQA3_9BILA
MPRIFKILLIVLLAVISVRLSASTDGKKTANDRNGKNASAGIGTKIKGIVTAGLLITSLATGGSEAIGRNNAHNQGRIAAGVMVYELLGTLIVPSYHDMNATHFYQAPPPPPANFEKATPHLLSISFHFEFKNPIRVQDECAAGSHQMPNCSWHTSNRPCSSTTAVGRHLTKESLVPCIT